MTWKIDQNRQTERNANISASGKRSAEVRKCPACERKSAMVMKFSYPLGPQGPKKPKTYVCRYCEHTKPIILDLEPDII